MNPKSRRPRVPRPRREKPRHPALPVEVWCDASVGQRNRLPPYPFGVGLIFRVGDYEHELSIPSGHISSVVHAELEAILAALSSKRLPRDRSVTVHTDCKAAVDMLNGIARPKHAPRLVDRIRRVAMDKGLVVDYVWIKGHDGHEYQTRSHTLAAAALETQRRLDEQS